MRYVRQSITCFMNRFFCFREDENIDRTGIFVLCVINRLELTLESLIGYIGELKGENIKIFFAGVFRRMFSDFQTEINIRLYKFYATNSIKIKLF